MHKKVLSIDLCQNPGHLLCPVNKALIKVQDFLCFYTNKITPDIMSYKCMYQKNIHGMFSKE